MVDVTLAITYFGILLGLGVIVASFLKKWNIPDTFFLIVLGLVLGPTIFANPAVTQSISVTLVDVGAMGAIPDFLRLLALIIIVFSGAFCLNFKTFKRLSGISLKLGVVGVIFSTIFLGLFVRFIFGLDFVYAFLLAAIISGTATEVILPFEKSLARFKKSVSILKLESIFNTPLTVLLPILFLDFVKAEPGALFAPMGYLSQFWLMVVAGIGTGIVIGLAVGKIIKKLKYYTVLTLLSVSLISYALAENVGGSGMLAVAITGIIIGNMKFKEKQEMLAFENQLSEMLRISVFTLLGASVSLFITIQEFMLIVAFFVIVVFSRLVFFFPAIGNMKDKFSRRELILMSFVAPRGLSAAAMAPIVATSVLALGTPAALFAAPKMMNIIFLVILLSVLFSTGMTAVLRRGYKGGTKIKESKIPDSKYLEVNESMGSEE